MKRDMDLIRQLLLKLEVLSDDPLGTFLLDGGSAQLVTEGFSANQITYHLELLEEAGLIICSTKRPMMGVLFRRVSWAGHDFLDAVQDDDTWSRTKGVAKQAGGFTVGLLKEFAIGIVKQKARDIGLDL